LQNFRFSAILEEKEYPNRLKTLLRELEFDLREVHYLARTHQRGLNTTLTRIVAKCNILAADCTNLINFITNINNGVDMDILEVPTFQI
jgi:hypothetical protein